LFLARLDSGNEVKHALKPGRHAWVHLAEGEASINGEKLNAGDALALSEETEVRVKAEKESQVLLFDLS
jgi:redox-sensitive bicupin YhaK (pirin superfamily)